MARGGGGGRPGGGFGGGGGRPGGGFGGGGRPSGGFGGGGRPGGGFGGGGRPGGGFGGGEHRPGGGFGWGGGIHRPPGHGHHPGHHGHHGHWGVPGMGFGFRPRRMINGGGGGCGSSVFGFLIVGIIVAVLIISAAANGCASCVGVFSSLDNDWNVSPVSSVPAVQSTKTRTPLSSGSVTETEYITDEVDFISSRSAAAQGMERFYERTGIQPHMYITDEVDNSRQPTDEQLEAFTNAQYEALFQDEAHFLLVLVENENDDYRAWYTGGMQTKNLMDDEAIRILENYFDQYYYDLSLSPDQFISKTFDDASQAIMAGPGSAADAAPRVVNTFSWTPVLIILGIGVILLLLFSWWNKVKAQKNREAEQTEKILNTTLETFGEQEAEERAKKYEDDGKGQ